MQSPPPLCEFVQYVDQEQSEEDKAYVQHQAEVDARWFALSLQEDRRLDERRKERLGAEERRRNAAAERRLREEAERRRRDEEEFLERQSRQAVRERMRERARRARVAGEDAMRKDKFPRCTQ